MKNLRNKWPKSFKLVCDFWNVAIVGWPEKVRFRKNHPTNCESFSLLTGRIVNSRWTPFVLEQSPLVRPFRMSNTRVPFCYKRRMNHGGQTEGISHQLRYCTTKFPDLWFNLCSSKIFFSTQRRGGLSVSHRQWFLRHRDPTCHITAVFALHVHDNMLITDSSCIQNKQHLKKMASNMVMDLSKFLNMGKLFTSFCRHKLLPNFRPLVRPRQLGRWRPFHALLAYDHLPSTTGRKGSQLHLSEFNIAPEKWWLKVTFQVRTVKLQAFFSKIIRNHMHTYRNPDESSRWFFHDKRYMSFPSFPQDYSIATWPLWRCGFSSHFGKEAEPIDENTQERPLNKWHPGSSLEGGEWRVYTVYIYIYTSKMSFTGSFLEVSQAHLEGFFRGQFM